MKERKFYLHIEGKRKELYFLEKTEWQVSDALHVAKTTLRRRHKEVLDKLRNILREET